MDDAQKKRYEQADLAFTQETREAFDKAFRGEPSLVEWLKYSGFNGETSIRQQTTFQAIYDELEDFYVRKILRKVLAESPCPLVAELKKTITESYIKRWAEEIARHRSCEE